MSRIRTAAVSRCRATRLAVLSTICLCAAGCAGRGTVQLVPQMRSDLPPGEPLMQTVPVNEAYYWVAQDGALSVALRYRSSSLLGKAFETDWQMSLLLPDLPAGSQKLYRLSMREVRLVQSNGGDHRRSSSLTGIAVVNAPSNGTLVGRFHVLVRQQQFSVLNGWMPPAYQAPVLVMVGDFTAVHQPQRGKEILAHTEEGEFGRPTLISIPLHPVTRPASQPARSTSPR